MIMTYLACLIAVAVLLYVMIEIKNWLDF